MKNAGAKTTKTKDDSKKMCRPFTCAGFAGGPTGIFSAPGAQRVGGRVLVRLRLVAWLPVASPGWQVSGWVSPVAQAQAFVRHLWGSQRAGPVLLPVSSAVQVWFVLARLVSQAVL